MLWFSATLSTPNPSISHLQALNGLLPGSLLIGAMETAYNIFSTCSTFLRWMAPQLTLNVVNVFNYKMLMYFIRECELLIKLLLCLHDKCLHLSPLATLIANKS